MVTNSFSLTVPMYHYVRDVEKTEFPEIRAISLEEFEKQLDYLQANHTLISWADLRNFLQGSGSLPKNPCLITFDDGFRDHYLNAFPVLKRRGISGLFFVIARPDKKVALVHMLQFLIAKFGEFGFKGRFIMELSDEERNIFLENEIKCLRDNPTAQFDDVTLRALKMVIQRYIPKMCAPIVERLFEAHIGNSEVFAKELYLSDEEMHEMKNGGMHFGGHGTRHFWFNWQSKEERADELSGAASMLSIFEEAPFVFSYPYGDYHADHFEEVKNQHYIAAMTANIEKISHRNPFEIHRVDAFQLISRLRKIKQAS